MPVSHLNCSIVLFVFHNSEMITAKILKLDAFQRGRLKSQSAVSQLCAEASGVLWDAQHWQLPSLTSVSE